MPPKLSPISISDRGGSRVSVGVLLDFLLVILQKDLFSDFNDLSRWNNIQDDFRFASLYPTILLDSFCIPNDNCNAIANGFSQQTAIFESDGSFCRESLIGLLGTSSVIVALETDCDQNLYAIVSNWITGPKDCQLSS